MLHLITGANGSGKTLFTLRWVRDRQLKENRQVYYNGRFRLKPEIEKEFGWLKFDFKDWQTVDDGAIFLVDEAQNDLPVRPAGQPPPDHVRMLAEHRVRGFDFYLITQHPGIIDAFVRRLIGAPGWHRHLKRLAGALPAVSCLHWDSVESQPEKMSAKNSADVQKMQYPREVYNWYESSTLHTAKMRVPLKLWIFVCAVVIGAGLLWYGLHSVRKTAPEPQKTELAGEGLRLPGQQQYGDSEQPQLNVADLEAYVPRVPDLPHTARRYDSITGPVDAPRPAACLQDVETGRCQCFSQQATPLEVSADFCSQIAHQGYFRDWKTPAETEAENRQREADLQIVRAIGEGAEIEPVVSQGRILDIGGRWDVQRWKAVKSAVH